MTMKDHIQEEVRKTLDFLESMPKLEGNPFLFTRIEAQIRTRESQPHRGTLPQHLRGTLKPVLLILLVAFNVFTLVRNLTESSPASAEDSDVASTLVHEYSLGPDPRAQFFTIDNE